MLPPPIALSVEDEGLDIDVFSWIEILLDGEPVKNVLAYDCRAGTVSVVCPCGVSACREPIDRRGKVEARWREGTPPA